MKNEKILDLISEALEIEIKDVDILLDTIPEFDSMGILMIMEVFEQHEVDLFPEDFTSLKKISDLLLVILSKKQ
tara:strand:- start:35 stop:256 length:222 start_codon:yes stop_codon:yes gene_type:complete